MRLLLLVLALLACAGLYLVLFPESGARLKDALPDTSLTESTDRVYKWRNAQGEWQLSDMPPPAGVKYERSDYHEHLNVLPVPPGIERK